MLILTRVKLIKKKLSLRFHIGKIKTIPSEVRVLICINETNGQQSYS